jgi:hypothetical protein
VHSDPDHDDDGDNLHGQHLLRVRSNLSLSSFYKSDSEYFAPDTESIASSGTGLIYRCYQLPETFCGKVYPLGNGRLELSRQHEIVKGLAAIIQIFFASKQLYDARGDQVEQYGYGAFGLTVLPYLWMSFMNFLAAICEPQYSHKYIVYYGGRKRPEHLPPEPTKPAAEYHQPPTSKDPGLGPRSQWPNPEKALAEDSVHEIPSSDSQVSRSPVSEKTSAQNCNKADHMEKVLAEGVEHGIFGAVGVVYGDPEDLTIPGHKLVCMSCSKVQVTRCQ